MSKTAIVLTALFLLGGGMSAIGALSDDAAKEDRPSTVASSSPRPQLTGNRWSIAVTANDAGFETQLDALPPGTAAFDLIVDSSAPKELQIFRLNSSTTFSDFAEVARSYGPGRRLLHLGTPLGGIGAGGGIAPGESRRLVLDLPLGVYAFVSFVNDDHKEGLIQRFDVVPGQETPAGIPEATGDLLINDGNFVPPSEPFREGVYRVVNEGERVHEAAIFPVEDSLEGLVERLKSGRSEVLGAAGFGITAPDRVSYAQLDLEPGEYALVCRLIDPQSKRPYFETGMLTEFSVE